MTQLVTPPNNQPTPPWQEGWPIGILAQPSGPAIGPLQADPTSVPVSPEITVQPVSQQPVQFDDLSVESARKIIQDALRDEMGSSSSLTEKDIQAIRAIIREEISQAPTRAIVREEVSHAPVNPITYVSLGIGLIALAIGSWNFLRASRKIKQDFDLRLRDREELLFGREQYVIEGLKQLIIQEIPTPEKEGDTILEADNPRIEVLADESTLNFGPYTTELAHKACERCTPEDPFFLEHIRNVRISRLDLFLDAAAERRKRHMWEVFRVPHRVIGERAVKRFHRELKISAEKAFSEGAIDAAEGKLRRRENLFVVPLCHVKTDGSWAIKYLVVSAGQLKDLKDPRYVEKLVAQNPELGPEIKLVILAAQKELEHQRLKGDQGGTNPLYPAGHSRHNQPREGRYMIPFGGWLRPKDGKNGKG